MDLLAFGPDPAWNRMQRVAQAGTYNANPLSAAAGIAMLEMIADGKVQAQAARAAWALRSGMSETWQRVGAPGRVYGESSTYSYTLEEDLTSEADFDSASHKALQTVANADAYHALRCALILNGVDTCNTHGWVSAVHTDEDIERTVRAFEKALILMREDGFFAP
jgi:glutamate-1-semialdehyde 2,1-aminomutase